MLGSSAKTVDMQRDYYAQTATQYDTMHAHEGGDDPQILKFASFFLRGLQAGSILDVGAGTGRTIQRISEALPSLSIRGVEPVAELIEQSTQKYGLPEGTIIQGVGENLPFANESFDVVCAFSILHHVRRPNEIVKEMTRVARKAVLICDANRFGQGRWAVRLLKLGLYKLGLWGLVNYLKTGGKGYTVTPGDGLAYSYSVYDSFQCLSGWADQLILIPSPLCKAGSWFHPLLTSRGVLVFALKNRE